MEPSRNDLELSEEQLTKLAKSLKEEKKMHVNKTRQKENKSFKKLEEMPLIKKKSWWKIWSKGDPTYAVRTNYKEELFKQLKLREPDLEKMKEYAEHIERGEIEEYKPIKSPYLRMIRSDGSVEWFEGVKAGTLEISRSDEKTAYIDLRKDKLLYDTIRNYDSTSVQGWDCYENDQNPLPQNRYMDSHAYFSNLEEIMANKKDVQTERLKQWNNIGSTIVMGLILLGIVGFVVMPMFGGSNILEIIDDFGKDGQPAPQQQTVQPDFTADELAILYEIRAQQQANDNAGGGGN